jgi:hypothetical protein
LVVINRLAETCRENVLVLSHTDRLTSMEGCRFTFLPRFETPRRSPTQRE